MRLTVGAGTFDRWRSAMAGLAVPEQHDPLTDRVGASEAPPFVAAALALHGHAELTLTLQLFGDGVRLAAHLAVDGGLSAALVRVRPEPNGPQDAWIQIALLPSFQVVDELARWVPWPGRRSLLTEGSTVYVRCARWDIGAMMPTRMDDVVRWSAVRGQWREAIAGGGVAPAGGDRVGLPGQVRSRWHFEQAIRAAIAPPRPAEES